MRKWIHFMAFFTFILRNTGNIRRRHVPLDGACKLLRIASTRCQFCFKYWWQLILPHVCAAASLQVYFLCVWIKKRQIKNVFFYAAISTHSHTHTHTAGMVSATTLLLPALRPLLMLKPIFPMIFSKRSHQRIKRPRWTEKKNKRGTYLWAPGARPRSGRSISGGAAS